MSKYRAYETAAIAAVDVWNDANELMAVAQIMTVPENVSQISKVYLSCSADGAAVGAGAFILRIQGDAVDNGPHYLVAGSYGGTLITTGGQVIGVQEFDVSIPVTAGGQIQFSVAMNLDLGICAAGVGVEYT